MDPPGQAISTATQELLRLAEANPGGIATLDPVNDIHLKGVDVVEGVMRQRVLQDSLKDFHCTHSPTFTEQVQLPGFSLAVLWDLDKMPVFSFSHFLLGTGSFLKMLLIQMSTNYIVHTAHSHQKSPDWLLAPVRQICSV